MTGLWNYLMAPRMIALTLPRCIWFTLLAGAFVGLCYLSKKWKSDV